MSADTEKIARALGHIAETLGGYAQSLQMIERSIKHLGDRIQTTQTIQVLMISLLSARSGTFQTMMAAGLKGLMERRDIMTPDMEAHIAILLKQLDDTAPEDDSKIHWPSLRIIPGGKENSKLGDH